MTAYSPPPSQPGAGLARVHHTTTQEGTTVTHVSPKLLARLELARTEWPTVRAFLGCECTDHDPVECTGSPEAGGSPQCGPAPAHRQCSCHQIRTEAEYAAIRTAAGQDQPTTEAPTPLWSDLLGAAPDVTGGACTQCYMDRARGREHDLSPEHAHCRTILDQPEPAAPAGQDQRECTASVSGDCLREAQSETACDTTSGECVYGGQPAGQDQPHDRRERYAAAIRTAAHSCDGDCGQDEAACVAAHPIQVAAWTHGAVSDVYGPIDAIASAVAAVADTEQQELREERDRAVQRAEAMEWAMQSTAADALKHRGCHRDLMAQCLRAERAEEGERRAMEQRQEMAAERFVWQERGDRAEAERDRLRAELAQARSAALAPAERASTYSECAERLRTHAATLTSSTLAVAYRTAADSLDCDADDIDPSRMTAEAQQTPSPAMDPAAILGIGADNPNRWAHRNAEAQQDTQPEEQPPVHLRAGANAEDCPACTNPPYPFICPGPTTEEPTS